MPSRRPAEAGLEVEFVRRHDAFRKEARLKDVLAERGEDPGLVHIFSAMEASLSFTFRHDKASHRNALSAGRRAGSFRLRHFATDGALMEAAG
jgi:hypothetical protein